MPGLIQKETGQEALSSTPQDVVLSSPVSSLSRAVLHITYQNSGSVQPDQQLIRAWFVDTSTIRLANDAPGTGAGIVVGWCVLEFDTDVTVQHIEQAISADTTILPLNLVTPARTSILNGGHSSPNQGNFSASDFIRYELISGTQANIERGISTYSAVCNLQVIDWGDTAAVERGSISVGGDDLVNITLTNPLTAGYSTGMFSSDFGGNASISFNSWRGYRDAPLGLSFLRDSSYSGTQIISWEAVDFSDSVGAFGMDVISHGNVTLTFPLGITVDQAQSIIFSGMISTWTHSQTLSKAGGSTWGVVHGLFDFFTDSVGSYTRGDSIDAAEIGWSTVEFPTAVPGVSGTGTLDDGADSLVGSGTTTAANFVDGTLDDLADAMAGTVYVSAHHDGAGALADVLDSLSGSGIVGAAIAAAGSLVDTTDSIEGIEIVGHGGLASLDDGDDAIAGVGNVISGITASGGLLDASDTASGAITVRHPATGTLTDGQDNIAASGGLDFEALALLLDAPDSVAGIGTIPINVPGDGALIDHADFLRGVGFVQLATDVLGRYFCEEMRETVIHDWGTVVTIAGQQARGVFEWGWDEVHDRFVPMLVLESCAHLALEHGTEVRATLPLIGDKVYWVAGIRPSSGGSTVVMLQEEDPTIPP